MSLPFVSEEDKVKENDIYLRMGTTNQLELRNMFLFLFHYLEKVSSLSCGPVEIYDRSRYQQWRYDCDPEAIEKKMGKQR